jgi:hypothetical protein
MPRLGAIKEKQGMSDLHTAVHPKLDIIDIRRAAVELNLKTEVLSSFHKEDGPRKLPTLLLYDERGLQLFEKVRRCLGSPLGSRLQGWRVHPTLTQTPTPDHIPGRVLFDQ